MKKIFLLLLLIVASCKTTKNTTSNSHIEKDTIRLSTTTTQIKAISDTMFIEQPCDSLGALSRFKYNLSIPNGKVSLSSDGKNIKYIIKTNDVIYTDTIYKEFKFIGKDTNQTKEIIKYRIPNWIIWVVFLETLIIIAYFGYKKLI